MIVGGTLAAVSSLWPLWVAVAVVGFTACSPRCYASGRGVSR